MATILVVDDEPGIHEFFRNALWEPQLSVRSATSAAEAEALFREAAPHVVFLDVHLGAESGLHLFTRLHAIDPRVPIIVMTGAGTAAVAIEAMALGAYEYLLKPFRIMQVRAIALKAAEVCEMTRSPALADEASADAPTPGVLVGRCPAMQEVYKAIGRVAKQDVTVLILGESGTGKELVARAIYQHSRRATGPFLAINAAAIPETLLESELFGHEKGAFTGAERRRIGKFEQCSGGTLFFDEIGDMTPLTQTKILRVLQEQRFERVGGAETIQTDVRLIAATHCDLQQLVASNQFREDLYYRIGVYTIRLPPLRERPEDLPLLVDYFVRLYSEELGKEVRDVAPETLAVLQTHSWPGNVRELQSVLKQAILHATAPRLFPDFLPISVTSTKPRSIAPEVSEDSMVGKFVQARLEAGAVGLHSEWQTLCERKLIAKVLEHTRGNLSQASRILGIDRGTLRKKIKSFGLSHIESANAESAQ